MVELGFRFKTGAEAEISHVKSSKMMNCLWLRWILFGELPRNREFVVVIVGVIILLFVDCRQIEGLLLILSV